MRNHRQSFASLFVVRFFPAVLCFALAAPTLIYGQDTAPAAGNASPPAAAARVWLGPNGQPLPFKTDEEVIDFLSTAKVVKMKDIPTGVAHPRKVLLEKDGIQMNAVFRDINEQKNIAKMAAGIEMFFRDAFIFEPAAYELSKMLGMDNIPPAVLRTVQGTKGSIQIWVENAMTQTDRMKNKVPPADPRSYNLQLFNMHAFDGLIYNTDRNPGNILFDKNWKVWLIDHTRAFRRHEEVQNPQNIMMIERKMWERLQALDPGELRSRLSPYLSSIEIDAMLKRREKLIELVKQRIAERGEERVLFDLN
jgi:hypothetical protein